MKKFILPLCMAMAAPTAANADTIFGLYAGYLAWQPSATGSITDGTNSADVSADLGTDETSNGITYIAIEHFVPLVPNVRLQMTNMSVEGSGNLATALTFGGGTGTGAVNSTIDLSHTDLIAYWEILDNIVSVDIGLAQRTFDGEYTVGTATAPMTESNFMTYVMAAVDIPVVGISVGMENMAAVASDSTITDTKIRIGYEFAFGLGLELGKRTVTMDLADGPVDTNALEFDGTYLAATYHF